MLVPLRIIVEPIRDQAETGAPQGQKRCPIPGNFNWQRQPLMATMNKCFNSSWKASALMPWTRCAGHAVLRRRYSSDNNPPLSLPAAPLPTLVPPSHCCFQDGFTVLHRACTTGNIHVVRLLLEAGVNVNAPDMVRATAWPPSHSSLTSSSPIAWLLLLPRAVFQCFGFSHQL